MNARRSVLLLACVAATGGTVMSLVQGLGNGLLSAFLLVISGGPVLATSHAVAAIGTVLARSHGS